MLDLFLFTTVLTAPIDPASKLDRLQKRKKKIDRRSCALQLCIPDVGPIALQTVFFSRGGRLSPSYVDVLVHDFSRLQKSRIPIIADTTGGLVNKD